MSFSWTLLCFVTPTNVEVRLVDHVSLQQVQSCFDELSDKSWTGNKSEKKRAKVVVDSPDEPKNPKAVYTGPVTHAHSNIQV